MGLFDFNPRYQPLAGGTDRSYPGLSTRLRQYSLGNYLFLLAVAIVSATIGALVGRRTSIYGHAQVTLPTYKEVFVYNRTFGADPQADEKTIAAWDSIVPIGQGSVRLPDSKKIYTLSVVHQLHCLWSIHQSYYGALHKNDGSTRTHGGQGDHDHSASPHMRHCFDYLRQSLQCAADSTLEPVNPKLGGVTGWGDERICRDYGALREWAEKRRVSNAKGFSDHGMSGVETNNKAMPGPLS